VAGEPAKQGTRDNSSGYLAPVGLEHIDHNIVYEYETRLIPGTVSEIRTLVKGWESARGLPSYRFEKGRMGWSVRGGVDSGVPLVGGWRLQSQATTMFLDGPATFWRAESAGTLKLAALWKAPTSRVRVAWKGIRPEDPEGSAVFDVPPSDTLIERTFSLKNQPNYKGAMQKLMLRIEALKPGDTVEVESIRLEP
jgi:hypothetical protein